MKNYLQQQYRETQAKFEKLSTRLLNSQERGDFQRLNRNKQNFLLSRIRKLWEKLRVLEVQLKISTVGASLALMLMVSNLSAQEQFVLAPEKNPLPAPSISGNNPKLIDIDNDGDLDLLLNKQGYSEGVNLYINSGSASAPVFDRVPDEENPFNNIIGSDYFWVGTQLGAEDVDNDGDIDMFSESFLLRNTGTNEEILYTLENHNFYNLPYTFALGDIDNDGDFDVISVDYDSVVYVYRNTGTLGVFDFSSERDTIEILNWNDEISDTDRNYLVDLDGDGDLDLLLGVDLYIYGQGYSYNSPDAIRYVKNTGTSEEAVFELQDESNNPYSEINTKEIAIGDMDNDGDFDVIMASYSQEIIYLEVDGASLAENKELIPEIYDGIQVPTYITPQFVDFDGDGDKDMFLWAYLESSYSAGMVYYEGIDTEEQLKFRKAENQDLAFRDEEINIQFPFFIDFDDDGDVDIIMLNYDYDSEIIEYVYMENTGSDASPAYTNTLIPALSLFADPAFLSFIDFDKDGDIDIFAMGEYRNNENDFEAKTWFFESSGDDPLEFTERSGEDNPLDFVKDANYEEGIFPYQIINFSDLDEDGDTDVVISGMEGLIFIEDTGIGELPYFEDKSVNGPFNNLELGYLPRVVLMDLDKDGDDDMLVFDYDGGTSYYENLGGPGEGYSGNQSGPLDGLDANSFPEFVIYPNPVVNEINVQLNNILKGELNYEIVSIGGKVMTNGSIGNTENISEFRISATELDPGYYFLKFKTGEGVVVSRFVKY